MVALGPEKPNLSAIRLVVKLGIKGRRRDGFDFFFKSELLALHRREPRHVRGRPFGLVFDDQVVHGSPPAGVIVKLGPAAASYSREDADRVPAAGGRPINVRGAARSADG